MESSPKKVELRSLDAKRLTEAKKDIHSYVALLLRVRPPTRKKILEIVDSLSIAEGIDAMHERNPLYAGEWPEERAVTWARSSVRKALLPIVETFDQRDREKVDDFLAFMSKAQSANRPGLGRE